LEIITMNPEEINLTTTSRQFSYEKHARAIDLIEDPNLLRELTKTYLKLYMKQQEVIGRI